MTPLTRNYLSASVINNALTLSGQKNQADAQLPRSQGSGDQGDDYSGASGSTTMQVSQSRSRKKPSSLMAQSIPKQAQTTMQMNRGAVKRTANGSRH